MVTPAPNYLTDSSRRLLTRWLRAIGLGIIPWTSALAQISGSDLPDLTELANISITTLSRHEEPLFGVPAAASVMTRDAAHDAGALNIPEALREVPGLNVAQITADTWAIGARGFQWQYANKLLVMIDGRSIYSPVAGGVQWEDNPVFMEDFDRVEIVRGPGSSIWGANAVNGVINIVSRSAFETQGSFVFGGIGNELQALAGARQGFRLSEHAALRVYGQYQNQRDNILPSGVSAEDRYHLGFGGLRFDWTPTTSDSFTLQAGGHDQTTDYVRTFSTLTPPNYTALSTTPITGRGVNASGNWRHIWNDGANVVVSGYWDRVDHDRPQFQESVSTENFDVIYFSRPGEKQMLSAGLGYRIVDSDAKKGFFALSPEHTRMGLFNAFIQEEISLRPEGLKLSLGTKVEHHESTGWNLQPTARLAWAVRNDLTVWTSVAQAVRVPTVQELTSDSDVVVYPPGTVDPVLPATVHVFGNPNLKAERLTAYELGIRWKSPTGFSLDLAGFAYDYRNYILVTSGKAYSQSDPPALVLAQRMENGIVGASYGGELALAWELQPGWRLGASYSYVGIDLHTNKPDPFGYEQDEDTTPHTTVIVTSDWRLGSRWQMHWAGRYVDPVPYYGIPAYTQFDARLAYQVNKHWEVSLIGRNLLDAQHPEYDSSLQRRLTELQRSINVICQWRY